MSAHHGHDDGPLDPPHLVEVAENVYAYIQPDGTWWINNTGFIVADDGVTAIDTCSTERRTKAFLETVAGVTDAPIRVVINTHHHGDHTHGNYLTHPATIIGHVRCRDLVIASGKPNFGNIWDGPEWGEIEIAPPFVTFDDHLTVWTGDVCAQLHYIGTPAHTTNDIVAYLPDQKVLYTGDLIFNGGTPFMLMGSVAGSLAAVERIRQFDADVIVPGHGPICDLAALDQHVRYYEFVLATAADARSQRRVAARSRPQRRPRRVRRPARRRAHRRQPPPGDARTRRQRTGLRHRPRGRHRRHGRLQRRPATPLSGLTARPSTAPSSQAESQSDNHHRFRDEERQF
ncbi:MAG: MBL fold metallo-hydrolase [Acidimicrobiales bacterium]